MTQSQLKFAGATSILAWAGKNSVLQYLDLSLPYTGKFMPYIRKDNMYYYFSMCPTGYELVMTSSRDLNGE